MSPKQTNQVLNLFDKKWDIYIVSNYSHETLIKYKGESPNITVKSSVIL